LHDRRFLCDLRAAYADISRFGSAWSPELERLLLNAYSSDAASAGPYSFEWAVPPFVLPQFDDELTDNGRAALLEAWLRFRAQHDHKHEVETYRHLEAWQGDRLPRLFGAVATVRPAVAVKETIWPSSVSVAGVLLEYVQDAITLRQLPESSIEREAIATICDAAVAIVVDPAFYRVMHNDLRLDNILVSPRAAGDGYRVTLIDLAMTRLLEDDEDEEVWQDEKLQRDYPGKVGMVVEKHLSKYPRTKGAYRYHWVDQPLLASALCRAASSVCCSHPTQRNDG
jgi:hypothetical protein